MQEFNSIEATNYSAHKAKEHFWFFFLTPTILFLMFFTVILSSYFSIYLLSILIFVDVLILIITAPGQTRIFLDVLDNKNLEFKTFFSEYKISIKFLGANILILLLLIRSLFHFFESPYTVIIKTQFVPYLIVDKKMNILEALKESNAISEFVVQKRLLIDRYSYFFLIQMPDPGFNPIKKILFAYYYKAYKSFKQSSGPLESNSPRNG